MAVGDRRHPVPPINAETGRAPYRLRINRRRTKKAAGLEKPVAYAFLGEELVSSSVGDPSSVDVVRRDHKDLVLGSMLVRVLELGNTLVLVLGSSCYAAESDAVAGCSKVLEPELSSNCYAAKFVAVVGKRKDLEPVLVRSKVLERSIRRRHHNRRVVHILLPLAKHP